MRDKHLFGFSASQIARAAIVEAAYHRKRQAYWQQDSTENQKPVHGLFLTPCRNASRDSIAVSK
jgi:hypothetical protein